MNSVTIIPLLLDPVSSKPCPMIEKEELKNLKAMMTDPSFYSAGVSPVEFPDLTCCLFQWTYALQGFMKYKSTRTSCLSTR